MIITIALIIIVSCLFYLFLTWNYNYWSKRGVKSPNLNSYITLITQKEHMVFYFHKLYRAFRNDEDYVGIYSLRTPELVILSPKLCHQIQVQHFDHFHDNVLSEMVNEYSEPIFGKNLYALTGDKWRETRDSFKPILNKNTLKIAHSKISKASQRMCHKINERLKINSKEAINAQNLSAYFTADAVSNSVFGFSFCGERTTKTIYDMIIGILQIKFSISFYMWLTAFLPAIKKFYKTSFIPKHIATFFEKLMRTAIDLRKSELTQGNSEDFLTNLVKLQNEKKLSEAKVTSYTMSFIFHGFELMTVIFQNSLLLLAKNPKSQEKLRSEIFQNMDKSGNISFENLMSLPYLDAILHETIRMFPPGCLAMKICTKPIQLVNKNGSSVMLEKGQTVILPFFSIMNDENFYTNPQEFQPERFLNSNGTSIINDYYEQGLYYAFGVGPRRCLGEQFSLMQIKSGLMELVKNYNISVSPKTKKDYKFDPKYFGLRFDGDIFLHFDAL